MKRNRPARLVGWHACLEWQPRRLYVGACWTQVGHCIDLYLCLLPCVPLHVSWWWTREPEIRLDRGDDLARLSDRQLRNLNELRARKGYSPLTRPTQEPTR